MGSIYRPLARSLGPHTLDWSSETWSKASERATVGLDQIRTRFFYRLRLVYSRSSLMRKPPQGFAIQLCGELKGSKGGCLNQDRSTTALHVTDTQCCRALRAHVTIEQGKRNLSRFRLSISASPMAIVTHAKSLNSDMLGP